MKSLKEQIKTYDDQLQVIYRKKERLENALAAESSVDVIKSFVDNCKVSFSKGYHHSVSVIDVDDKLMDAANKHQLALDGFNYHFSIQIDENYNLRFDDEQIRLTNSLIDTDTANLSHLISFLKSIGFKKEQFVFDEFENSIKNMENDLTDAKRELASILSDNI